MAAFTKCAKFLLNSGAANRGVWVTYAANQITSNERSLKTDHRTSNVARGDSSSYCRMLQKRREEAERSISVWFPLKAKVSDILRDIEEIGGPVKNALYYRMQNENNILLELEDPTALKKLLHDRIDLYRVLRYHPQSGTAPFYGPLPKNIEKDEMMYEEFDANILNEADTISEQINTLHSHLKMRPTQTRLKFFTCQRVEEMLKWLYPEAMVLPFGSGATGLGLVDGSDLDMNLAINEEQDNLSPSLSCIDTLRMTRATLQKAGKLLELSSQFNIQAYILHARVPIIKFKDSSTGFECDLSCSSRSGLTMSQIQYLLSKYDERFHPLITVLRVWSKAFKVRLSGPGPWLSNFMLQMLIVHFLQTRNHPVLPTIKDMYRSDVDDKMIDRLSTSLEESFLKDISELPVSANKQSIGDLLIEFFQYYADFNFSERKIDLFNGALEGLHSDGRSNIWVENPFEKGLNICKNVRRPYMLKFRKECLMAVKRLETYATKTNSPWGLSYVINPTLTIDSNSRHRHSTDKPSERQRPSTDKPSERQRPSTDKPSERQRPSTYKPSERQIPSTDKPSEQQRPSTYTPSERERPSTDKPNKLQERVDREPRRHGFSDEREGITGFRRRR